jgi:hypothetical protein
MNLSFRNGIDETETWLIGKGTSYQIAAPELFAPAFSSGRKVLD